MVVCWFSGGIILSMFLMSKVAEKYLLELFILFGPELVQYLWAYYFNEPATFWRVLFITTLIISIIGLKVLA